MPRAPAQVMAMEIRKVQITGGSSYVVSLPKEWARSLNIRKNDPLGLIAQSDGTLLITPKITGEAVQRVKIFDASAIGDPEFFFRCLVGAYIMGYTAVTITAPGRIPPRMRMVVLDFTRMVIGQEVTEENDTTITIRDLINPAEMTFESTLRRMHILARGMHEDIISALKMKSRALAKDATARDRELDRLHWLIARQYHLIQNDSSLARRMQVTVADAACYALVSRIIERIGDHAVNTATTILPLLDSDLNPDLFGDLESVSAEALTIFDASISAMIERDIRGADANIRSITGLAARCDAIARSIPLQSGSVALAAGSIVESIRRLGECSKEISKCTINRLIAGEA